MVTWRHRRPVVAMPSLALLVTMAATKSACVRVPPPAVMLLLFCCACCHGNGCAFSAGSIESRWYLCTKSADMIWTPAWQMKSTISHRLCIRPYAACMRTSWDQWTGRWLCPEAAPAQPGSHKICEVGKQHSC